ncbi:hypothetical protein [Microbispora sp. CA-102843]|uniref:hypothetical protein n=1 Tax=Microbispora sp. CA-102843 TaxID=3239952 RepID=UPI003D919D8F
MRRGRGRTALRSARRRPLYDVLAIKIEFFAGAVEAEYRAELFAEAEVIVEDVMASFESAYLSVVEATLGDAAEELDLLDAALSAADAAAVLVDTLSGIVREKAELWDHERAMTAVMSPPPRRSRERSSPPRPPGNALSPPAKWAARPSG